MRTTGISAFLLSQKELHVSTRLLLAYYAIIPITVLVIFFDVLVLGGTLKAVLPYNPEKWAFWTVVFNLPHIMASMMTFADREYLSHYRKPLLAGVAIGLFFAFAATPLFGAVNTFMLLACYTMYHVMMQQFGIGMMLLGTGPTWNYRCWRTVSVAAAIMLFILIYAAKMLSPDAIGHLHTAIMAAIVLSAIFTWRLNRQIRQRRETNPVGYWYFIGNAVMPALCYAFFLSGYSVLALIIPRVIHDVTAYTIYMVHDHNRNREQKHNFLYFPLQMAGLSPLLLCLPLSIALAYGLQHSEWKILFPAVTTFHYFIEGYMWRKGTPHRNHVRFT